jgi:hypothetical protein
VKPNRLLLLRLQSFLVIVSFPLTAIRLEFLDPHLRGILLAAVMLFGVGVVAFGRILGGRGLVSIQFLSSPVIASMLCYYLSGIASGFFAINRGEYLYEVATQALWYLVPLYLFGMGITSPRDVRRAVNCYLPVAIIVALAAILRVLVGQQAPQTMMASYSKSAVGDISAVLFLSCVINFLSFEARTAGRTGSLVGAGIGLTAMIATVSRSDLVGSLIGLLVVLKLKRTKWQTVAAVGIVVLLLVAVGYSILPHRLAQRFLDFGERSSPQGRLEHWSATFQYLSEHPLGFAGWGQTPDAWMHNPSNMLLEAWLSLGPIGAVSLLCVFVFSISTAVRNCMRAAPRSSLQDSSLVLLGIIIIMTMRALQDAFMGMHSDATLFFQCVGTVIMIDSFLARSRVPARQEFLGSERRLKQAAFVDGKTGK